MFAATQGRIAGLKIELGKLDGTAVTLPATGPQDGLNVVREGNPTVRRPEWSGE